MSFTQAARGPVHAETLLWFTAMNRETEAAETLGLWTGSEDATFVIDGEPRLYIGVSRANMVPADIVSEKGVVIQTQSVSITGLSDAVNQLIKGFDARQAPCQMHSVQFDPDTQQIVATDLVLDGFLNKAPATIGKKGGETRFDIQLNTDARNLTRTLPLTQSDAYQRQFNNDRFMQYADVSGSTEIFWGMERQ